MSHVTTSGHSPWGNRGTNATPPARGGGEGRRGFLAFLLPVFALVALITGAVVPQGALAVPAGQAPAAGTTNLVVKFKPGVTATQRQAGVQRNGGTVRRSIPQLSIIVVSVPSAEAANSTRRYQADAQVLRVEADHARKAAAVPNDPAYADQWALPKIGWDGVYGAVDPAGSATIAVLDTGVDTAIADLAGRTVAGHSALEGGNANIDDNGHGTRLASIAAAAANNGAGIAGVGYAAGVKVMPVKVLDNDGLGQDSDVIPGVVWAADNGAKVILMGFSAPEFSQSLQDAVDYAWSKGAVLVAATGNAGSSDPTYPAGDAKVVGVSATDQDDALWSGSNHGAAAFLAAPGVDIVAGTPGGGTASVTGTSASAAVVAGAAALLGANDPAASPGTIVGRLARNADAAGTADQTGNGRVNLARALGDTSTEEVVPAGAAPLGSGGPFVGPYVIAAATVNSATLNGGSSVTVSGGASITAAVSVTSGSGTGNRAGSIGWRIATTAPGTVTCVNIDDHNNSTMTHSFTITAPAAADTYNAYFVAYSNDTCSSGASSVFTLSEAVVVSASNPVPTTTGLSPTSQAKGGDAFTLTVNGTNFISGSVVRFAGFDRPTALVSTTQVTAAIPATDLATLGSFEVRVFNPTPGGGLSNAQTFTVNRGTSTSVACSPASLSAGESTSCTATVTDTSGSGATAPDGTVSFATSGGGSFASTSCTLGSPSATSKSCSVSYTTSSGGSQMITATYAGNATHASSSGTTSLDVLASCSSFSAVLEGQSKGSAIWQTTNLQNWNELEEIPSRVRFCGPASNQQVTVTFNHTKTTGSTRLNGIDNLIKFTPSSGVTMTNLTGSFPSNDDTWSYTFTVTKTGNTGGFVEFRAVLSADAHNFTGSSLQMGGTPSLGQLQIAKPGVAPGTPDLRVTKSGPTSAAPGSTITYTLDYGNKSTAANTATGVQLKDLLPDGLTYVSGSCTGCTVTGQEITWSLGSLAPGDNGSRTLQATVPSTATNGTEYINKAQIRSAENDAAPADNDAQLKTTVTVTATASISGTVYNDANGNGSLDSGDAGIGGVTVTRSGSSAPATTDASGNYSFTGLLAGEYTIDYGVPTGYANTGTKPRVVTVATGASSTGNNFFARRTTSTSLALTAGTNPSTYGDAVTFTATVTSGAGNPNSVGTVTFNNGSAALCSAVVLSGNTASCSATGLSASASAYSITAVYSGTSDGGGYSGSTSAALEHTVNRRPITVTAAAKSKIYGEADPALTYEVTSGSLVAGDAFTGALTRAAGENVGPYAIEHGTLALSANYALTFAGANLTINPRPITVTAHAKEKVYGADDPALSYEVTGSLVGTDAFTGALTRVAGEDVGNYQIQQGTLALSNNYALSYVPADLVIKKATSTVTVTCPAEVTYTGAAHTPCSAEATGAGMAPVTGLTVTYTDNTNFGTATASASWAGDANHHGSTGSATFAIAKANTGLAVDAKTTTYSEQAVNVTLTATVSNASVVGAAPVNEGTVTFAVKQGVTTLVSGSSATVAGGGASKELTLPAGTAAGSYTIDAAYSPGPNFNASSGNSTLTVDKRATTTSVPAADATFGDSSVTLNATVAATPADSSTVNAGTVTFTVKNGGGTVVGRATESGTVGNGRASVSYALPTGLAVGTYTIDATYNPSPNFLTSSAAGAGRTLTVGARATTVSVSASPNPVQYSDSTTLTAIVTPANAGEDVTGTVQFWINGGSVGTAPVVVSSGAATATLAHTLARPVGSYALRAVFTSTSANFAGSNTDSQSPAPTLTVVHETMDLEYTGQTFVATNKVGGTATVAVSARVTEDQDGSLGTIPWNNTAINLRVKFTIYSGNTMSSTDPNCTVAVSQGSGGTGTAGCSFSNLKEGVYTVHAELLLNSYYVAQHEDVAVNVVDPGTGFTTGGGWINDPNTGKRSNFGLTAKFLKNGSVQGNSLFIYRQDVNLFAMGVTTAPNHVRAYNFWIKSNAMDGLKQKCTTDAGAEPCWATITGKSNVKAIDRDTGKEYTLGADIIGNQQFFQVDVTDTGEPGSNGAATPDGYAIRVWTSSGNFYQVGIPRTSFDGTPNGTQVPLAGGNVQVRLKK